MTDKVMYVALQKFLYAQETKIQEEIDRDTKEYAENPETDEEEIRDRTYDNFPDQRLIGYLLGQQSVYADLQEDLRNFYEEVVEEENRNIVDAQWEEMDPRGYEDRSEEDKSEEWT